MTVICIAGMAMLVFSQHYFNKQHMQLNLQRDNLLRLSVDLLQLRRNEKDFLLRGQMRYVDQFNDGIEAFNRELSKLEPLIIEYEMDVAETAQLSQTMVDYQRLFKRVVQIHRELGLTENSGLRGKFDQHIEALKQYNSTYETAYLLASAQLAQRDLLLTYDSRFAQRYAEMISALPVTYSQHPETASILGKMSQNITTTSELIQQMGETETEGLRGEFRRQAHLMESQLTSIDDKVQPIITDQAQRIRMYNFMIAVFTCVVLVMVLVKSFATFHRAFSYFVMFFYQCKREYQRIDPKKLGFAEFKSLAELANEMVEARKKAELQLADAKRQLEEKKDN